MRRLARTIYEVLSIATCSLATGAGVGFIEGCVAFRGHGTTNMVGLGAQAAYLGALVSLVWGPLLYYALLGRSLTFAGFAGIVFITLSIGVATAFAIGWMTCVVTPLVALGASVAARTLGPSARQ
jgi:hypothetical protein